MSPLGMHHTRRALYDDEDVSWDYESELDEEGPQDLARADAVYFTPKREDGDS